MDRIFFCRCGRLCSNTIKIPLQFIFFTCIVCLISLCIVRIRVAFSFHRCGYGMPFGIRHESSMTMQIFIYFGIEKKQKKNVKYLPFEQRDRGNIQEEMRHYYLLSVVQPISELICTFPKINTNNEFICRYHRKMIGNFERFLFSSFGRISVFLYGIISSVYNLFHEYFTRHRERERDREKMRRVSHDNVHVCWN